MTLSNGTTEFAYADYRLIAEFDALSNDNLIANYTWQVNPQDVPVMATINGTTALYIPDGNKNIVKLLSLNGEVLAEYRYSPFGKVVSSSGILAEANPFRFSSEYHDDETTLVYYNYRYYSPALGRWLSRDPIEEQGGYNLYGMVKNNIINIFDNLGLNWNNLGPSFGVSPGDAEWRGRYAGYEYNNPSNPQENYNANSGLGLAFFFNSVDFVVDDRGCMSLCHSFTTTAIGIGGQASGNVGDRKSNSPLTVVLGTGKYTGFGSNGSGLSINGGASIGLGTIVGVDLSYETQCYPLNSTDNNGCPC